MIAAYKCPGDKLVELVNALPYYDYAKTPIEDLDREGVLEILKASTGYSSKCLGTIIGEVLDVNLDEVEIIRALSGYGKNREKIIENLGMHVMSCPRCRRDYYRFLRQEVVRSNDNPDSPRGPYEDVFDADLDFLRIGPRVLHW